MHKTWRDVARPLIAAVIKEHGTDDMKKLRKALREAYPWHPRTHHPYKIWCDEIRVQLGLRKFGERKPVPPPKEQMSLWESEE